MKKIVLSLLVAICFLNQNNIHSIDSSDLAKITILAATGATAGALLGTQPLFTILLQKEHLPLTPKAIVQTSIVYPLIPSALLFLFQGSNSIFFTLPAMYSMYRMQESINRDLPNLLQKKTAPICPTVLILQALGIPMKEKKSTTDFLSQFLGNQPDNTPKQYQLDEKRIYQLDERRIRQEENERMRIEVERSTAERLKAHEERRDPAIQRQRQRIRQEENELIRMEAQRSAEQRMRLYEERRDQQYREANPGRWGRLKLKVKNELDLWDE